MQIGGNVSMASRLDQQLAQQDAGGKPLEFLVCVCSELYRAPGDLFGAFDGLRGVQEVGGSGGKTLLVGYWTSEAHFNRAREAFLDAVRGSEIVFAGPAGRLLVPMKPRWRRVKWGTALLTTAALLGALEVISNRYDRFFARPELAIRPDKATLSVLEGDEIEVSATVENLHPVASHRDLRFRASLDGRGSQSVELKGREPQMTALLATKTRTFSAAGRAPAPGNYTLRFEVTAGAGWWYPDNTFHSDAHLRVWPRNPKPVLSLKQARGTGADLVVLVDVGPEAAFGIMCELTLKRAAKVEFDPGEWRSIDPTRIGSYLRAGTGEAATARLRWTWGPISAHRTVAAELTLLGEVGTDWPDVVRRATVGCTPMKETDDVAI